MLTAAADVLSALSARHGAAALQVPDCADETCVTNHLMAQARATGCHLGRGGRGEGKVTADTVRPGKDGAREA